jgi:hypothetical protein
MSGRVDAGLIMKNFEHCRERFITSWAGSTAEMRFASRTARISPGRLAAWRKQLISPAFTAFVSPGTKSKDSLALFRNMVSAS